MRFGRLRKSHTVEGASSSMTRDDTLSVLRERVPTTDRPLPFTPPRADKSPSPMMIDNSAAPESEGHTGSAGQRPVSSSSSPRHIPLGVASPKTTAALNAFKAALQLLGKAKLLSIGVATSALVEIISRHQDLTQIEEALQRLTNCMERVGPLVHQVIDFDEQNKNLCEPLVKELEKLQEDLEVAGREGRLVAFFNTTEKLRSINEHISDLDGIIIHLTFFISARTNKATIELREDIQKAIRTPIQNKVGPSKTTMVSKISGNNITDIEGDLVSGNNIQDNAAMINDIHDNEMAGIWGSLVSRNIVGGNAGMINDLRKNKFGKVKGEMLSDNLINTESPSVDNTPELANDLSPMPGFFSQT